MNINNNSNNYTLASQLDTWYRPVPDKLANNYSSLILSIFTISEQNCTGPLFVYCGSFSGLIEKLPDGTALIILPM